MAKYSFELSGVDEDVTDRFDRYGWVGADTLVAEGDTLEEVINNATVFCMDQDGGEVGEIALESLSKSGVKYYEARLAELVQEQDDKEALK